MSRPSTSGSRLTGDSEFDPELCFLVEVGDDLAAAAICWSSAFVKDIVVHENWRRRGFGESLLRLAFRTFQERGATHVELKVQAQNAPAIRLYERVGMRTVEAHHGAAGSLRATAGNARLCVTYVGCLETQKIGNIQKLQRRSDETWNSASALVVHDCGAGQLDVPAARDQRGAAGREDVPDPIGVPPVGERDDIPAAVAEDIDGRAVDLPRLATAVHDDTEARKPRCEWPGDTVGDVPVEVRDAPSEASGSCHPSR